ncbi:hypothetical protein [Desulfobacula sp.]
MISPANKQTLTHRVLKVGLGKPLFLLPCKDKSLYEVSVVVALGYRAKEQPPKDTSPHRKYY